MNDVINGAFELVGAVLVWASVRELWRDREVKGVSLKMQGFVWVWGLWNLWYYPSLGQWWSFAGGVVLVLGNGVWVVMAIHFTRQHRT